MELRLQLLILFFLHLLCTVSSTPYYRRILRRDDEFFKPFNLLGQAQAPMDDYDSTVQETWIEDNPLAPNLPEPDSSFKLIETPVQLSNPIYNFWSKANAFYRWIRNI